MIETWIEPTDICQMVETYVYKELDDARKFDNSEPLDESGIWSLHQLARRIYARGVEDGVRQEQTRTNAQRQRDTNAQATA